MFWLTFPVPFHALSRPLSIWGAKLGCDVTHIAPSLANSAIFFEMKLASLIFATEDRLSFSFYI